MATKKTQGASAKDLLSNLTAGKNAAPKKTGRADRPELKLSPALEQAFINFAGAVSLGKEVNARIEREKDFLNDGCFQMWTETLWRNKNRPANPALEVEKNGQIDIEGIYQVREHWSLNQPELKDGQSLTEAVIEKLSDLMVAANMSQDEADTKMRNLVNAELILTPKPIIDLDRLVNGREGEEATPFQQAIAAKLIKMIQARSGEGLASAGVFTDEEAEELLEYKAQIAVKAGFLNRICGYVNNVEQLRLVFSIVKPTRFPQAKKFAASDTQNEANRRKLAVACDILGIS